MQWSLFYGSLNVYAFFNSPGSYIIGYNCAKFHIVIASLVSELAVKMIPPPPFKEWSLSMNGVVAEDIWMGVETK